MDEATFPDGFQVMRPDLPPELWQKIFSYLDLEDLAKARLVSREWWDLVNVDRLWRPLLLKRRITTDFVVLEKEDDDAGSLQSCDWAKTCSLYYNRVHPNWRERRFRVDRCTLSTEYVFIRLPYMLTTFDPYRVVNVYRLVDADFMLSSRLPLPDDGEDGCFVPQMTSDTVFVVSKNAYSLIFKLHRSSFKFEKAVCLSNDNEFKYCSTEENLANFLRNTPHSDNFFKCCSATEDTLWIFEEVTRVIFVWNYQKSELMFQLNTSSVVFAHSTRNFVYCVFPDQLSVHAPSGRRLILYKRIQSLISGFCWDEQGCGFIENRSTKKTAIYLGTAKNTITELGVVDPLALAIHENLRQAHCFCVRDGTASVVTASLTTGAVLKETVICPSLNVNRTTFLAVVVEMRVVLGKYLAIYGVDGEKNSRFISSDHLSLYSLSEEKFLWSHPFNMAKIVHLSDQFIVTRGPLPRGGMRYIFEVYNFL